MASVLPLKPQSPSFMLEEGASLRLCETVLRWRYEDLPPAVVRVLKSFLIDTLGVIGGAARAPGIAELHARLTRWERDGAATALIGKRRLSPPSAALAGRIRVVSDPAIEPTAIEPARVKVTLRDGRTTELTATVMKGSPQQPLTEAELLAKFHDCLEFGLGASRAEAERLAQAVAGLERSTDVARDIVDAFPLPKS